MLLEIEIVVQIIRNFPYIEFANILSQDNDDYSLAIKHLKRQYKAIGLWLSYYLLNAQELTYDFQNNYELGLYKPLAERTLLIHRFVQEVKALSTNPDFKDFNLILLGIEYEIFQQILIETGIYGTSTPKSKRTIDDELRKYNARFEDTNKIKYLGNTRIHSFKDLLFNEAISICKIPENYKFRGQYKTFLAQINKIQNTLRKSELQVGYIHKNKLKISGRKSLKPTL